MRASGRCSISGSQRSPILWPAPVPGFAQGQIARSFHSLRCTANTRGPGTAGSRPLRVKFRMFVILGKPGACLDMHTPMRRADFSGGEVTALIWCFFSASDAGRSGRAAPWLAFRRCSVSAGCAEFSLAVRADHPGREGLILRVEDQH